MIRYSFNLKNLVATLDSYIRIIGNNIDQEDITKIISPLAGGF